jgi:hypothetical protein
MKQYLLLLRSADFTKNNNIWESVPVNVYVNDSYINYSYKRSSYGLNLIGDSTYTGLELASPSIDPPVSALSNSVYITDVGEVVYEEATPSLLRFIDTTSRVDVLSYRHVFTGVPGDQTPEFNIKIYESDSNNGPWLESINSGEARSVYVKDVKSYIKIVLDISSEIEDLSVLGLVFYLELAIYDASVPVLSSIAKNAIKKFPSWTSIYSDSADQATPSLYVPQSSGAKLINSLVQESLDSFEARIDDHYLDSFISGADENILDWAWASYNVPANVIRVVGDGVTLARVGSFDDFYNLSKDDYAYYYNVLDRQILTNRKFDTLFIDVSVYSQSPVLIYNQFDEFGARVGLPRLYLENNSNYKLRILDVYTNPPGVNDLNLKLTLRRELDIWRAYGATPNSDFEGATPEILEISDIENSDTYFLPNGKPLRPFIDLVEDLNRRYPANIGYVSWDDGMWDYAGILGEGVSRIPATYDTDTILGEYFSAGVGDFSDAEFSTEVESVDDIAFNLVLRAYGQKKIGEEDIYSSISIPYQYYIEYDIEASESNKDLDDSLSSIGLCYEIEVNPHDNYSSQKTFYINFNPENRSDFILTNSYLSNSEASPEFNYIRVFDSNGYTLSSLQFRDKITDEPYLNTSTEPPVSSINISDVNRIILKLNVSGWNQSTQSYDPIVAPQNRVSFNLENTNYYVNAAAETEVILSGSDISESSANLLVGSTLYTSYTQRVRSDIIRRELSINDLNITDISSLAPKTISIYDEIDNIIYPSDAELVSMRIEVIPGTDGVFGGYSVNPDSLEQVFLPSEPCLIAQAYDIFDSPVGDEEYFSSIDIDLLGPVDKIVISSNTEDDEFYPLKKDSWENFSYDTEPFASGYLDRFGNFYEQDEVSGAERIINKFQNNNALVKNLDVNRSTFSIELDEDEHNFTGLEVISNTNKVDVSTNFDIRTIGKYEEINEALSYQGFQENKKITIPVYAVRNEDNIKNVSSSVNPGWIYLNEEEYYIYSKPILESYNGRFFSLNLDETPRSGSPLIISVNNVEYRRIPDFGNENLGRNSEIVKGNSSNNLYLSYENIYDATVVDLYTGKVISTGLSTLGSELEVFDNEVRPVLGREYKVDYILSDSYYLDKDFYDEEEDSYVSRISFFATPNFDSDYKIIYESDSYDTRVPIDLNIEPSENPLSEGYIYASLNQYPFGGVQATLSPNYIIDSEEGFMYMAIVSYDTNGNPKPYQAFEIHGDLIESSPQYILTNSNGFGLARVRYTGPIPAEQQIGTVIIDGISISDYYRLTEAGETRITEEGEERLVDWPINEEIYSFVNSDAETYTKYVDFYLTQKYNEPLKVKAVVDKTVILANGISSQFIFGRVTYDNSPVDSGIVVFWRKSRSIKDLLNDQPYQGYVYTDQDGRFTIGPIASQDKSDPGYWFVSLETNGTSSTETPDSLGTITGDIVYWNEQYDNIHYENESLPLGNNFLALPDVEEYLLSTPNFVYRHIDLQEIIYTESEPNWIPPKWLAIDKYTQYQMGLFGATPNIISDYSEIRPDYQED